MIAGYRVEIARRALKSIQALPKREQQRVRAAIELLADTPRPLGCVALQVRARRIAFVSGTTASSTRSTIADR